jgi:hypothetical protein
MLGNSLKTGSQGPRGREPLVIHQMSPINSTVPKNHPKTPASVSETYLYGKIKFNIENNYKITL